MAAYISYQHDTTATTTIEPNETVVVERMDALTSSKRLEECDPAMCRKEEPQWERPDRWLLKELAQRSRRPAIRYGKPPSRVPAASGRRRGLPSQRRRQYAISAILRVQAMRRAG